jgi:transcriptional regulator with PAS, ATPase and Fis domain
MLVGDSQVMQQLRVRIQRVAATSFTVLIEGESGAGKELVAREIHAASDRRRGPFVAVNCAALVETLIEAELFGIEERTATGVRGRRGKFEMADDGTLFLDEVADLSPTSQAKLLRVLQDRVVERVGATSSRSVNTRVIAATNQTLRSQVDAGRFRTDLYYRLAGVEVTVPPLRARRGDVPLLVDHFLRVHQRGELMRVADSALDALRTYDWPGNVRQLERVIERAIALAAGRDIAVADLPAEVSREYAALVAPARNDTLRAWSSRYARFVLERTGGNKRQACDVLDISYQTLRALLSYGAVAERSPLPDDPGLADEPVRAFAATPAVELTDERRQLALWDALSADPHGGTEG